MAESKGVMLHTKKRLIAGANATLEDNIVSFSGGVNVALCKILEPMSPMLNYFEIKILDQGQRSTIAIGVGGRAYSKHNQPGWRRNSIGYHADDGNLYHERGYGKQFGPVCTTGDVMGCGIDFDSRKDDHVSVFFTRNGKQVGTVQSMKRPVHGFYPLFGLHSRQERIAYLGHWRRLPEPLSEPMETNNSPLDNWLRSNGVRFAEQGSVLQYDGLSHAATDVAMAQANFPISQRNHYFELEILEGGQRGAIAIGLCKTSYLMHIQPGFERGGVAYHAKNGNVYKDSAETEAVGPTCSVGDRMGCGVTFSSDFVLEECRNGFDSGSDFEFDEEVNHDDFDYYDDDDDDDDDDDEFDYNDDASFDEDLFDDKLVKRVSKQVSSNSLKKQQCTVYFTKNGDVIAEVECTLPSGGFYPVVSMLSAGEKINVDFQPYSG